MLHQDPEFRQKVIGIMHQLRHRGVTVTQQEQDIVIHIQRQPVLTLPVSLFYRMTAEEIVEQINKESRRHERRSYR